MQRTPPELTKIARQLRREVTFEERRLWEALRPHRPKFTRQLVVDRFVVDFACRSLRIAVELDGGHHAVQEEADSARTAYLEAQGWLMLRFWNSDVRANLEAVVQTVLAAVAQASTHPRPLPFREG